jgi:N-acetylglucosamine kinase-like BadF-type ATPase
MQLPDSQLRRYWLGIDGGAPIPGAVLVQTGPDAERTLGEGRAEAANQSCRPEAAVRRMVKAVTEACSRAEVAASETTAACVGLAGVQPPETHRRMLTALKSSLPIAELTLETDARVALRERPIFNRAFIIAGTGSISWHQCSWAVRPRRGGATMGDEEDDIGKRAPRSVMARLRSSQTVEQR